MNEEKNDRSGEKALVNLGVELGFGKGDATYRCMVFVRHERWNGKEITAYQASVQNENKTTIEDFINEILSLGIFGTMEKIKLPFSFSIDSLAILSIKEIVTKITTQLSNQQKETVAMIKIEFWNDGICFHVQMKNKFMLIGIPLADQIFDKEDYISDINICFANRSAEGVTFGASFSLLMGKEKKVFSFGNLEETKKETKKERKKPTTKKSLKESELLKNKPLEIQPKAEELWQDVRKKVGPISIDRIGISVEMPKDSKSELTIFLRFDANLTFSIIELSMMGLRLGLPLSALTDFNLAGLSKIEFGMDGLGLTFEKGGLSISGGFLKQGNSYRGVLSVRYKSFQLSAIGEYSKTKNGKHSLFAFCLVKYPLGGPPAFFITGLAAGFGLNRRLKVPSIDKIASFPLIQMVRDPSNQQQQTSLMKVLGSLHEYIEEAENQYFIAVGVEFTTCNVLKTFALAMVSFGTELEIYLLGISTLTLPVGSGHPMVYMELAIKAAFLPKQGKLTFEGKLTEESYLFDKNCKLHGGFAMYLWFGDNPHAGDFVITIGGYHPLFQVPDHYPKVDRVGIRWAITQHLLLEGDAYFALTPNGIMAGGRLSIVFTEGNLKAWFKANADFLLEWAPFHYDINVSISIGVSYTLKIWKFSKTFTVELGAGVHLFGPDFSGEVNISWTIISFTIRFGDKNNAVPRLSWMEFRSKFLNDPQCFRICAGLIDSIEADEKKTSIVRGYDVALSLQSKTPVLELFLGQKNIYTERENICGVLPMGENRQLANRTQFRLMQKNSAGHWQEIEIDDYFECTMQKEKMAPALWGMKRPSPYTVRLSAENVTTIYLKVKENSNLEKTLQFYDQEILEKNQEQYCPVEAYEKIPRTCKDYLEEDITTYQEKRAQKKPIGRVIKEMKEEHRQAVNYLHNIYPDLWSGESSSYDDLLQQEQDHFVIPPVMREYR